MINLLYVTAANKEEALKIGRTLVEENLAACVNILDNMSSIYRWEGKINEDKECVLIVKTDETLNSKATARILELHSYSCPCVLVLPVTAGNPAYLKWLGESL